MSVWMCLSCSDTVSRCGMFCAIATTIEQCKTEGVVDVFQAVKALRVQKPGAVRTVVQMAWYLPDTYLWSYYQVFILSSFRSNTNSYLRLCWSSSIHFPHMLTSSCIISGTIYRKVLNGTTLVCETPLAM